jgi:hypothetical protein
MMNNRIADLVGDASSPMAPLPAPGAFALIPMGMNVAPWVYQLHAAAYELALRQAGEAARPPCALKLDCWN